ncbi:MAG: MFS transporter [Candidatus Nanopelagicales bacterium]
MKHSPVRYVKASVAISAYGSALAMFALAWLSYQISGSLLISILVLSAGALPSLVLMKTSAEITQRFDVRVLCANLLWIKVGVFVLLALLIQLGYISVWLLLIGALFVGVLIALFTPSYNLILRSVAPPGQLDKLDASLATWVAGATIIGLISGGLLMNTLGAPAVFLINSSTYLPMIFVFMRLPAVDTKKPIDHDSEMGLRATIGLISGTSLLRRVVLFTVIFQLLAWPLTRIFQHVAKLVLDNPLTFSMLLVSFQIGALLVGPVLTISEKRATYSKIVQRTSLILVLALILVAVAGELPGGAVQLALIMVVLIPFGLAVNLSAALLQACMQVGSPDTREPAILAIYAGCISLVGFIGTLAISALVSFVSLWIILAVEGVLLGLLMIVANRTRWFADLDAAESDAGTTAIDRIRRHHNGRLRYGFASFGHSLEPLSVGHHRTREEAHGAGRAADPGNPPVSGTGLTNPPG